MGPITHLFISIKTTGKKDNLLLLGSVFPDINTTSLGKIDRLKIHDSPDLFYDFVKLNYPNLLNFALGYKLHSPVNQGADFYSDDEVSGYAKVEGKQISADVANLLNIPESHTSLVLAHNFIEFALDLHLLEDYPNLMPLYQSSLEKKYLDQLLPCLSEYLNLSENEINKEFLNFKKLLAPKNYLSQELIAKKIILPLIKLIFKKDVDYNETLKIMAKAFKITDTGYKKFLDKTIQKIKVRELKKDL